MAGRVEPRDNGPSHQRASTSSQHPRRSSRLQTLIFSGQSQFDHRKARLRPSAIAPRKTGLVFFPKLRYLGYALDFRRMLKNSQHTIHRNMIFWRYVCYLLNAALYKKKWVGKSRVPGPQILTLDFRIGLPMNYKPNPPVPRDNTLTKSPHDGCCASWIKSVFPV